VVGAVFLGTSTPRLDEKGRIFLPAKWRTDFAQGVVITRGQERCLYVWPRAEFVEFTERFRNAPLTNKAARDFLRMLFAGASDDEPDRQGRVTIPPPLRTYAGLSKDVVVVGSMTRVEIWDPAAWQSYQDEKESVFADVSEEVLPGLL
jgi:MraZ protein